MPDPFVELRGIVKAFPGAVANAGIDLAVYPGEVLAILGENGAGKSTLMSILAGLYRPDAGTIAFDGRVVDLRSPGDAVELGIGMVHQHFRLVESFTVAENVLLGWDRAPFLLNLEASVVAVERLARDHGLAVDPRARIWQLSVGERQRVEILSRHRGANRVARHIDQRRFAGVEQRQLRHNLARPSPPERLWTADENAHTGRAPTSHP